MFKKSWVFQPYQFKGRNFNCRWKFIITYPCSTFQCYSENTLFALAFKEKIYKIVRILYVCKSSRLSGVVVTRNINIFQRPIFTKHCPKVLFSVLNKYNNYNIYMNTFSKPYKTYIYVQHSATNTLKASSHYNLSIKTKRIVRIKEKRRGYFFFQLVWLDQ